MSSDPADLPWFLQRRQGSLRPVPSVVAAPGQATAYARAAFNSELGVLAAQTEPGRNEQLNKSAFALAQLVAAGHLEAHETWQALYGTAMSIGLEPGETVATLRSAFGAGEEQPRVVEEREGPPPVTVLRGPDAAAYEWPPVAPQAVANLGEEPPSVRERFPALDWHDLWAQEDDEEWIVYPILPARRLVALFSPPKVGKSLLMLELAVAIARGEEVLGHKPKGPRRVLYVDFENDPRGDVRARLKAMGRGPDELGDLVYLSYPRLAYLDTYVGGLELASIAEEYGCEVIVIDTISRAVGGEENDNDTWLGFYRNTGLALKAAGRAVIRLDHTGKDPSKGMRGGSAKYGDVDAVWSMTAVAEGSLQLECTANRLPIADKVLVLHREDDPLRHRVDGLSRAAATDAKVLHCAQVMDHLGLELDLGTPTLLKRLEHEGYYDPTNRGRKPIGQFSRATVEDAQRHRRDRVTTVDRPFGDLS